MTEDSSSDLNDGIRERDSMYPEDGYVPVRIDLNSPPGEALSQVASYESLDDIDIIPPNTDWEEYVVYDSNRNAYSHGDL